MQTTVAKKIDQKVPPGALMRATIEFLGGEGGVTVSYDHAPEKPKGKGDSMGYYQPRRPDGFSSIEEACHAIVQAAGGQSSLEEEEYDEAKK